MGNQADRMRDLIHEAATEGTFEGIRDDLARTFDAIGRQGASVAAFSEAVTSQLDQLWAQSEAHGDAILALSNRIEAAFAAMATRADLDDLRLDVREATATPFDPERPHAA